MRRAVVVLVAALLGLLVVPALAASGGTRSASASYSMLGGATFTAAGDERAVSVRVEDRNGRAVGATVGYTDPAGSAASRQICGRTPAPVAIAAGSTVSVTPTLTGCSGLLSALGGGTVSATFAGGSAPRPAAATPAAVAPATDRWALVIGISRYDAPTHPTYGGAGDAAAVRTALLHAGWRPDHIRMLVDGAATAAAMRDGFAWLAGHSGPHTFSFMHYSGHVKQRGGHEFLWPVDNRLISDDEAASVLRQVTGKAWFDFAGCESAGFDEGLSTPLRVVSTSSQVNEKSYEVPDWHESVWTGLVFDQGIVGGRADTNGDHRVSIAEAVRYGAYYAPRMTAGQQPYGPQHPHIAGGDGRWQLSAPPA